MKLTLPRFGDTYVGTQMRELIRQLENGFANVVQDQRRGAITVTGDYTLQNIDTLVMVAPAASGAVTITVPDVAQWMVDQKWEWEIKLIDAGTLIIQPVSDTIDGTTDAQTTIVNTALAIRATNDGWKVV